MLPLSNIPPYPVTTLPLPPLHLPFPLTPTPGNIFLPKCADGAGTYFGTKGVGHIG